MEIKTTKDIFDEYTTDCERCGEWDREVDEEAKDIKWVLLEDIRKFFVKVAEETEYDSVESISRFLDELAKYE